MSERTNTIADDVRRNAEAGPVQLLPAGHWLARKGRMLETCCAGAGSGNSAQRTAGGDGCPAYVHGGIISQTTCPGLGVRHDGLPTLSDMQACRLAAASRCGRWGAYTCRPR
ncbi:MAG TPA: hypothetical protein VNA25_24135 [Phycisphaerae bacterium]|nr:hypothetical protein [Phycisphaerae bacterium]